MWHQRGIFNNRVEPGPGPPPPPPPPPPPFVNCLNDLRWDQAIDPPHIWPRVMTALDMYGNYYADMNEDTFIYSPTGTVNATVTTSTLKTMIDTWFGAPIVTFAAGEADRGLYMIPVLDGEYILAWMSASLKNWFAVLTPSQSGTPTFLGAVFSTTFLGPFYTHYPLFLGICNGQTADDPTLWRGTQNLGGAFGGLLLTPSINAIASGIYKATGYNGLGPCRVPRINFSPIAGLPAAQGASLSLGLLIGAQGTHSDNLNGGFVLPASDGGTNLYFYFNRFYTENCIAGVALSCPEVGVIGATHPNGSIVKIPLGVIDFDTAVNGATPDYAVDNSNWLDGASAAIPFPDEYTYLSSGAAGGQDVYTMMPGGILNRGGGTFWLLFYMPGLYDAENNGDGTLWERVKIFAYDSATEVATLIKELTCVVYTGTQMPYDPTVMRDSWQTVSIADTAGGYTVTINGIKVNDTLDVPRRVVYRSDFAEFGL